MSDNFQSLAFIAGQSQQPTLPFQHSDNQSKLAAAQVENATLSSQNASLRSQLSELQTKVSQLELRRQADCERIDGLTNELENMERDHDALQVRIDICLFYLALTCSKL